MYGLPLSNAIPPLLFFTVVWTVVVNLKSKKTRGKTIIMISMLSWCKNSRTYTNGHFPSSRRTRNPYIDSCLKPLYKGHLFKTATFFCPQGCLCREVHCIAESTPVYMKTSPYRAFSHDFTSAIWLYQNNKAAAMLVFQTNPFGIESFSYVKTFFFPINLHSCWPRE